MPQGPGTYDRPGRPKKGMGGLRVMPKMPGGGRLYDYMRKGGKLKMVKNDKGEMVPFYAADGIGKMEYGGKTMGHGGMMEDGPMLVIKLGKDGMKYMQEGGKNEDEGFGEGDPYEGRAKGARDNKLLNDDGETMFNSGIEGFNPKTLGEFSSRFFVRDNNEEGSTDGRFDAAVKLDDGRIVPISKEQFLFMNEQFRSNDYGNSDLDGRLPEKQKRSLMFYLPEFNPNYDEAGTEIISSSSRESRNTGKFNRRFDKELDQFYDTEAFDVRAAAMATDEEKERLKLPLSGGEEKLQKELAINANVNPVKRQEAHRLGQNFAAKTFFEGSGDAKGIEAVQGRANKFRSSIEGIADPTEQKDPIETSGAGMNASGMQRIQAPDFSTPIPSSLRQETASAMNFGGRLRMANQGAKMARRTVFRFPRS